MPTITVTSAKEQDMTTNYEPIRNEADDLVTLWRERRSSSVVSPLCRSARTPVEAALLVALICDRLDSGERADLIALLKGLLPRHLESCHERNEGGINGKTFWVCGERCPTMRERQP